jgi:hypothetical protein
MSPSDPVRDADTQLVQNQKKNLEQRKSFPRAIALRPLPDPDLLSDRILVTPKRSRNTSNAPVQTLRDNNSVLNDFPHALAKARLLYQNRMDGVPFERCRNGDRWHYAEIVSDHTEPDFRFQVYRGFAKVQGKRFVPTNDERKPQGIRSSLFSLDPDVDTNRTQLEYYLSTVMVEMIEDDWIFAPHPKRRCWYAVEFVRKY